MLGGVYFLYTELHWTFTTPTTSSHMLDRYEETHIELVSELPPPPRTDI